MDSKVAERSVRRVVKGMPTSDGAGVRLTAGYRASRSYPTSIRS